MFFILKKIPVEKKSEIIERIDPVTPEERGRGEGGGGGGMGHKYLTCRTIGCHHKIRKLNFYYF